MIYFVVYVSHVLSKAHSLLNHSIHSLCLQGFASLAQVVVDSSPVPPTTSCSVCKKFRSLLQVQ